MNLRQLSELLSLSQTTVSRALNGYPEVAEPTRRRVLEAAKQHGYRPNPSARRLATGKAGMIGYVLTTGDSIDIDPHFLEFLSGLADYARSRELDLSLSPTAIEDEENTYRRIVANRQVDAIYVSSPTIRDRRVKLLDELGIPFIVHGQSEGLDFDYAYLDIDNEGAFHEATRLLVQLGHRRIGLINGEATLTFAINRERGFRRALMEAGPGIEAEVRSPGAMTEANGYRAAHALFALKPRPTAIVCSSLLLALGVVRAARDHALDIPGDVSLISHDDDFPYLKPESFPVPLSTTRSPIRAAGARIAERLAAKIAGGEPRAVGEVWPVDLIVRGSVAHAPDPRMRRQSA